MKKSSTLLLAIALIAAFEACSKNENPNSVPVTGFEGSWAGKFTPGDSAGLIINPGSTGTMYNRSNRKDTLKLTWNVEDNKGFVASYVTKNLSYRSTFYGTMKNDSLKGSYFDTDGGKGTFYFIKK